MIVHICTSNNGYDDDDQDDNNNNNITMITMNRLSQSVFSSYNNNSNFDQVILSLVGAFSKIRRVFQL